MTAVLGPFADLGPAADLNGSARPEPAIGCLGSPRLLAGLGEVDLRGLDAHMAVHGSPPRLTLAELLGLLDAAPVHGRGGAGFPLATKLRALRRNAAPVVVVNGAEGEPASAKDRVLLSRTPNLVLDGAALVADAIGADRVVVGLTDPALQAIISTAAARRGDRRIEVRRVPARFIAGEARALLDALAGGRGVPPGRRLQPTERGLDGRPTLLSNVETFAQLAVLARIGPQRFAAVGATGASGLVNEAGTTLLSVTGAVDRPAVLEVPLGVALGNVAEATGAGSYQAVIVGGYHGAWLPPDPDLDLSRAGLKRAGGTLGAGAVIFLGQDTCALGELSRVTDWLAGESAKQCGPCAFGLPALAVDVRALLAGVADESSARRHLAQLPGRGACAHPDGAVRFVTSGLAVLADEVAEHRRRGGCGRPVQGHLVLS